jgi:hypothetical protein
MLLTNIDPWICCEDCSMDEDAVKEARRHCYLQHSGYVKALALTRALVRSRVE